MVWLQLFHMKQLSQKKQVNDFWRRAGTHADINESNPAERVKQIRKPLERRPMFHMKHFEGRGHAPRCSVPAPHCIEVQKRRGKKRKGMVSNSELFHMKQRKDGGNRSRCVRNCNAIGYSSSAEKARGSKSKTMLSFPASLFSLSRRETQKIVFISCTASHPQGATATQRQPCDVRLWRVIFAACGK